MWKWHYPHAVDIKEGRDPTFWETNRIYLVLALHWDGYKDRFVSTFLFISVFRTLTETRCMAVSHTRSHPTPPDPLK